MAFGLTVPGAARILASWAGCGGTGRTVLASDIVVHQSGSAPRPLRTFLNPGRMLANLWSHRQLILQLARRDIAGRYRAARLGLLWSIITPLIMLAIYTFVFSVIFKGARFGDDQREGHGEFAIYLFCGMLIFNLFGEVATRAPQLVVAYPNYVKKVVFPLEVLVVAALLTALFNMAIGYGVWLIFWCLIRHGPPPLTAFYLPLVVVPLCLATTGVGWFLASLGVFVRDIGHAVLLVVQALFFATPVFYTISSVPRGFQVVMELNPLSHALEDARRVMIRGSPPEWIWWFASLAGSVLIALAGYAFFMKSKRAFADVL